MTRFQKIAAAISGSVAAVGAYVLSSASSVAHAAGFTISTTTVNDAAGSMLQPVFDFPVSLLTSGGVVLLIVGILLIGGIIALVYWGVSKLFKRNRA